MQPGYLLTVRLMDLGWGVRKWLEVPFRKVWTDKTGKTYVQVIHNDAFFDVKPEDVRVVEFQEVRRQRAKSKSSGGSRRGRS